MATRFGRKDPIMTPIKYDQHEMLITVSRKFDENCLKIEGVVATRTGQISMWEEAEKG